MVFGILNKIIKGSDPSEEIEKVVPISECAAECSSCTSKFPSSMKIDTNTPLYNSTSPFKLHCVIPTGKADWNHSATDTSGSVEHSVSTWASKQGEAIVGGNVKVSVSNHPLDEEYPADVNDVLLLPYFVWVRKVSADNIGNVLSKLIPLLITATESGSTELPQEVEGFKIEPSNYKAYIFLCSHKTRDKRCGITAPIMKREFDSNLREMDLLRDFGDERPGGVNVGFINHVGGHKFVANLLIYMKSGEMIWMARTTPANCKPILEETIMGGGKVWPDKVRIVQKSCAINW
ncbi:Apd1 protein [Saccharomycopsis crataegensis]|uniref:Apd1 protein n=1 Tax=Saccharomycopsis crataegensis TaxID=43959 RepID=A0AAV5QS87_9ASCO|nr:Apd1 protein [Saccharomycopsis crataegensis]